MNIFKSVWFWVVVVLAVLGLALVSSAVGAYNNFTTMNRDIDGKWAQVENEFQRRFDLIPNLVNSVKGIQNQEQAVFLGIAEARTQYSGAVTPDEKAAAAGQVQTALGRLLAVIENYPNLRSSENVSSLMFSLEGTENRIAVERMRFNEAVTKYNTAVSLFPANLFAGVMGFGERKLFDAAEGSEVAPKVEF